MQNLCRRDESELAETSKGVTGRSVDHGAQSLVVEFRDHPPYACSVEELGSGAQSEIEGRQIIGIPHPIPQLFWAGWITESESSCVKKASARDGVIHLE